MGNVVKFKVNGKEYPISLVKKDVGKIVLAQQIGEAIGNKQIKSLIFKMQKNGEIQEGRHLSSVKELNSRPGNPRRLYLTYRGVIRVAMRSQGTRAREFRDWAEDVLYEVMMTGHYGPVYEPPEEIVEDARGAGFKQGFFFFEICKRYDLQMDMLIKLCRFRTLRLTQKEAAVACGISSDQVKRIEKDLKEAGIRFKPVNANKRNNQFLRELPDALISAMQVPNRQLTIVNPPKVRRINSQLSKGGAAL